MVRSVFISGFKSIERTSMTFDSLEVLIGKNGAGKSNLFEAFGLLDSIFSKSNDVFTAEKTSGALLHGGSGLTDEIRIEVTFNAGSKYCVVLGPYDGPGLLIRSEELDGETISAGPSYRTSLDRVASQQSLVGSDAAYLLTRPWRVFRFQNTSSRSGSRWPASTADDIALHPDGSNIAAVLYRMKNEYRKHYNLILMIVRHVAPYLDDFVLEPSGDSGIEISLRWKEKGLDNVMSAHQLSDGTLRFICLATLLLQPVEFQPDTMMIDEPELGMHPDAIVNLGELLISASRERQVLVSTQSVELLNEFESRNIMIVTKDASGSHFDHLDPDRLSIWLDQDYSLGELWMSNIIGERS